MSHQPNPFSTRFVRPGAIPFHFRDGESAEQLVENLQQNHWQGEIIGPHGTGKSTLLESLKPFIEIAGRSIVHIRLTAERPSLKAAELFGGVWNAKTLIIIDGYEQLHIFARCILAARRRISGAGMLITAHEPTGFPPLYQTRADEPIFSDLVELLVRETHSTITRAEAAQALQASNGNVRDALFRLYDLYESRRPSRL
jgi:hypothetical protein